MTTHLALALNELIKLIRSGRIRFAGNKNLKIYGRLQCSSGKRMKKDNRVFFATEHEAQESGYRPCKKCMRIEVRKKQVSGNTPKIDI